MTTHTQDLGSYLGFAATHPDQFVNVPGGIEILLDEADIHRVEALMAGRLEAKALPVEWARVGIVFQDQYSLILRDAVRFPDGTLGTYIRSTSDDSGTSGVVVLPRCGEQVLLIRHFRHALRTWSLEIPRGFGITGLSVEENARRELEEEIGAIASRLVSVGRMYPDTGMSAGAVELFYAEVESYDQAEIGEAIAEIVPVTLNHLENMIRTSGITDGYTLAAYARAKLQGLL